MLDDSSWAPLETDEPFKRLGPETERALDLVLTLMPESFGLNPGGFNHPPRSRRRMLFEVLVTCLDPEEPLRGVLTSAAPQSTPLKTLYFLGLYNKAKKQGIIDDIDGLCQLMGEASDSLNTYLYR